MSVRMQTVILTALLVVVFPAAAAAGESLEADPTLTSIINDIEAGWENGDGAPFREHFLDFPGARYIESGGQNNGLDDLVEHHVEPEGDVLSGLDLIFSNIETHIEGDFAWALANTEVKATVKKDQRVIHNRGYETFLFRRVGDQWKVVHTHSSSRPVKVE